MLASDLNNAEFMGAKDPDSGLYVEFYWHEPVDGWASRIKSSEEQRNVVVKMEKQPFVRIMVPGDKTSEFCAPVGQQHKQRFPRQWIAWQIAEGLIGGTEDIPGWKLSEWPDISEDLRRELQYLRFQTVEQLAGANDRQIQGIGIGGLHLREKARVALRDRMGAETREALQAKEAENVEMRARMDEMQAQIAHLMEARKPGRPKLET